MAEIKIIEKSLDTVSPKKKKRKKKKEKTIDGTGRLKEARKQTEISRQTKWPAIFTAYGLVQPRAFPIEQFDA